MYPFAYAPPMPVDGVHSYREGRYRVHTKHGFFVGVLYVVTVVGTGTHWRWAGSKVKRSMDDLLQFDLFPLSP